MSATYRVTNLRMAAGERMPLLVNAVTGIPLWNPTIFLVTELRATGLASATLGHATRAIMVALQILEHLGIDLETRLAECRLLEVAEMDALVDLLGLHQSELDQLGECPSEQLYTRHAQDVSVEKVRMQVTHRDRRRLVRGETKGIRLMYIRDYVAWLARRRLLQLDHREEGYQALAEIARLTVGQLSERVPSSSGRTNNLEAREGLGWAMRQRILKVIDPESPENPWMNKHVRARNQLIFLWLLGLGLRRSELLGVRIGDIDLRTSEVAVQRRADDPMETRADPPLTKTKGRLLALDDGLAELTRRYIHGFRFAIKRARLHPFLIVATGTGAPLSKAALGKLFIELRTKVPGLPEELSAHVLRHTWNEDFSRLMDDRRVPPEDEEKMRRQQMGWSDTSKMAAVYTRRHIRRKAAEASLALQAAAFGTRKKP